jgi:hypothetical protein
MIPITLSQILALPARLKRNAEKPRQGLSAWIVTPLLEATERIVRFLVTATLLPFVNSSERSEQFVLSARDFLLAVIGFNVLFGITDFGAEQYRGQDGNWGQSRHRGGCSQWTDRTRGTMSTLTPIPDAYLVIHTWSYGLALYLLSLARRFISREIDRIDGRLLRP